MRAAYCLYKCSWALPMYIRTMRIFNFYGLCRIGYRYIDYFLIRIRDLVGFLGTQGLDDDAHLFMLWLVLIETFLISICYMDWFGLKSQNQSN